VSDRVLEYVFPLRDHFTATLWLPRDLTAGEVRRITTMLETLVVDHEPVEINPPVPNEVTEGEPRLRTE